MKPKAGQLLWPKSLMRGYQTRTSVQSLSGGDVLHGLVARRRGPCRRPSPSWHGPRGSPAATTTWRHDRDMPLPQARGAHQYQHRPARGARPRAVAALGLPPHHSQASPDSWMPDREPGIGHAGPARAFLGRHPPHRLAGRNRRPAAAAPAPRARAPDPSDAPSDGPARPIQARPLRRPCDAYPPDSPESRPRISRWRACRSSMSREQSTLRD